MPNNLLTFTEKLDDGSEWSLDNATVLANQYAAPAVYGGNAGLADRVEDNTAAAQGQLSSNYHGASANTNYVGSFFLRKDTDQTRFPSLGVQFFDGASQARQIRINTQTGELGVAADATAPDQYGIVSFDATWWRVWMRVLTNGSTTDIKVFAFPAQAPDLTGGAQSSSVGFIGLWGANLTEGAILQTYYPDPSYNVIATPFPTRMSVVRL